MANVDAMCSLWRRRARVLALAPAGRGARRGSASLSLGLGRSVRTGYAPPRPSGLCAPATAATAGWSAKQVRAHIQVSMAGFMSGHGTGGGDWWGGT